MLVGRRGAEAPEARQAVAELEQKGTRVVVHAADVSKESDVASVLGAIEGNLPPLRGVLHAAMVLDDALLINLDRFRMQEVLAPKMCGAWNLHAQTASCPLDFFIMFSSISSVFGHAGQGSYAAANAFLDAMAWYRRSCGLPALSVNWGHLGEVGYIARRAELSERLVRQGVLSLTVSQALAGLEKAIVRQHVQVSVMRADWTRWREHGVTDRVSPRFAHLCGQADGAPSGPSDGTLPARETILAADSSARRGLLQRLVGDKVARILGTSPDRLDSDKPLLQLGVDSLMAVELRNWLEGELQVDLPIVELMRSPSISGLVVLLAGQLEMRTKGASDEASENGAVRSAGTSAQWPLAACPRDCALGITRPRRRPLCRAGRCPSRRAARRENPLDWSEKTWQLHRTLWRVYRSKRSAPCSCNCFRRSPAIRPAHSRSHMASAAIVVPPPDGPAEPGVQYLPRVRFRSPLDLPAFCRTLRKLIDRHPESAVDLRRARRRAPPARFRAASAAVGGDRRVVME